MRKRVRNALLMRALGATAGCGVLGGEGKAGPSASTPDYVGPRDVVVAFYAAAAELNCEGAADQAIALDGAAGKERFVSDCESADDLTWAQQAEVGEPSPADDADLKAVRSEFSGVEDLVEINVSEGGNSSESASSEYVIKIDGEWKYLLSSY